MIKHVTRKSMVIRESGRSTDFISPSFGFGCLLNCSYCYMKRHTNDNSLSIAKNTEQIISSINDHVTWLPIKTSNQTDSDYWTYDISCNEDFALHAKHHDWKFIFDFFKNHPKAKASFATKINPKKFSITNHDLLLDDEQLKNMSKASFKLGKPKATSDIVDEAIALIK